MVKKGIDLVDKVVDVVDKTGLSAQENQENLLKFVSQTIEENSERSIARRKIAVMAIKFFFWYVGINTALYVTAAFVGIPAGGGVNSFMQAGNMMKDLAGVYMLGGISMIIFVFFFGNHGIRAWKGK